ncbi:DNA-directed RNA polymerase III, subunit Rpc31 [Phaffia rhodozyma]|uniref:DNA-directed RNA polymerase III subunit n=1 Tax=Phaffia rhodozyma TaxID=264483 RepID=A0A0F7SSV9_PHARH|nr:DNA-directed RNA polymerase III, subunit Rpc31 [Phaffia rhodozyma]
MLSHHQCSDPGSPNFPTGILQPVPLTEQSKMSFRGGRGGGRGGAGGRGGPGEGLNLMGMTYAEISSAGAGQSEELFPQYPHPFPTLPEPSLSERAMVNAQVRFGWDMSLSREYLKEPKKVDDIERYTDKYKPVQAKSTALQPSDYPPKEFFPQVLYESYFNPKSKLNVTKRAAKRKKLNLDDIVSGEDDDENAEGSDDGNGTGEEEDDYDVDEGDDDYGDNYFDNGEDEDGGGDDGGDADGGTFD